MTDTTELTLPDTDDAEAIAAAEQAELDADTGDPEYVGFVGCEKLGLLKVRVTSRRRGVMRVACPCGEVHVTTSPLIRARQPGELVTLLEEGPPPMQAGDDPPPEKGDSGQGRRQVSDQQIFDAVPVGESRVLTEVAETLGYATTAPLLRRLRQTNARAEKKDTTPPFKLERLPWRGMSVARVAP